MKLIYAHNGVEVEASGKAAEALIASGCFKPAEPVKVQKAETPKKRKTTSKE